MIKTKNTYLKIILFTIILLISLCTYVFADDSKYVTEVNYKYVGEGLSLTWTPVPNATGYTIYIKGENDEEYTELDDEEVNGNTTIIKNIDPSAKYSIKILAYTEVTTTDEKTGKKKPKKDYNGIELDDKEVVETTVNGENNTSNEKIDDFKCEVGEISKVVYVTDADADRIWRKVSFTWKNIKEADGYTVFLKTPFSPATAEYESTSNNYYVDLPNHEEGEKYNAWIGAYKLSGQEKEYFAYSKQESFSITDKKHIQTPYLYDIKVEDENAVLRWNPVENVDGYEIYLSIINVEGKDEEIKLKPEDAEEGYLTYKIGLKNYKYGFKAKVRAFKKSEENSEERNYGDYSNERVYDASKIFTDSGITFNASEWGNATRIVNNWDGVNIYEHADTSSKVLATIGYATEVTVTAKEATYGPTHKDTDGKDLWWAKIKIENIEGYINAQKLTPETPEKIGNYRFFIGIGDTRIRYYEKLVIYTEPDDKTLKETKTEAGSVKVIGKSVTTTLTPGEWAVIEYADGKDGRAFVHSSDLKGVEIQNPTQNSGNTTTPEVSIDENIGYVNDVVLDGTQFNDRILVTWNTRIKNASGYAVLVARASDGKYSLAYDMSAANLNAGTVAYIVKSSYTNGENILVKVIPYVADNEGNVVYGSIDKAQAFQYTVTGSGSGATPNLPGGDGVIYPNPINGGTGDNGTGSSGSGSNGAGGTGSSGGSQSSGSASDSGPGPVTGLYYTAEYSRKGDWGFRFHWDGQDEVSLFHAQILDGQGNTVTNTPMERGQLWWSSISVALTTRLELRD